MDYKVSFNQAPCYTFNSFDSSGNFIYSLSSAIDGSVRVLKIIYPISLPPALLLQRPRTTPCVCMYAFVQGNGLDVSHGKKVIVNNYFKLMAGA